MKSSNGQTAGRSLAALVLGGVVIGLSPIFVRLSEVGPVSTAVWRVALALLPLLALKAARENGAKTHERPRSLRDVVWLIFPGVMLAGDLIAWHLSIQLTSVANASLLANVAPIFVTLAGWLLFRSRVSRQFLAGLVLAVCGVVVLNSASGSGLAVPSAGDALALLAALFYAGYMLSLARLRSRYSTLTTMLWTSMSAGVFMLPVALLWEPNFWPTTALAWSVLIALAWLCHAGGQGLIIYALAKLPASFSSLTLLIQPVVAACAAWLLLNEPLGPAQVLGGAVVLIGILIARRG